MDATGGQATDRTRDLRERRSQNQSEQMALDLEIFQKHMGWERKQRGKHGLFLQGERCDFTRNFAASELIILLQKPSFEHKVGNEKEEIL